MPATLSPSPPSHSSSSCLHLFPLATLWSLGKPSQGKMSFKTKSFPLWGLQSQPPSPAKRKVWVRSWGARWPEPEVQPRPSPSCLSYLGLPEQVATNSVASNTRNSFSRSSGGWKSQISFPELKSRCKESCTPSRGSGGESILCLVQPLVATSLGSLSHCLLLFCVTSPAASLC